MPLDTAYGDALAFLLTALGETLGQRIGRLGPGEALTAELCFPTRHSLPETEPLTSAAHLLAAIPGGPHALLTAVYQTALSLRPAREPTTGRIVLTRALEGRRAGGVYYTPGTVAHMVAAGALAPFAGTAPRVLDPAMGTAVFLLEAARILAKQLNITLAEAVEQYVFGLDRDPLAVRLAVLGLWLETGARPELLRRHLRRADALVELRDRGERFDAIIGNPPWGVLLPSLQGEGTIDSFKLFLSLATRLTAGTVGMVLPQAMLEQPKHADARDLLLDHLTPYALFQFGDRLFPGAAAPACALIFGPRPGPTTIRRIDRRDGEQITTIPTGRWTVAGFSPAPAGPLDLLQRLCRDNPTLGALERLYRVRDVGMNYNHATVARRSIYQASTPDDPRDQPYFRGRDFVRYTGVGSSGWLRHDVTRTLAPGETFSCSRVVCGCTEKIVLRQTADRLVATLDCSRMVWGRSVLAITAEGAVSLPALLACLNSRLLTLLYRTLAGEEGRVLPQVKVSRLRALPLPAVCAALPMPAGEGADDWNTLDRLARILLRREGADPSVEQEIDLIVYRLYRLTETEIRLVEGRMSLTTMKTIGH